MSSTASELQGLNGHSRYITCTNGFCPFAYLESSRQNQTRDTILSETTSTDIAMKELLWLLDSTCGDFCVDRVAMARAIGLRLIKSRKHQRRLSGELEWSYADIHEYYTLKEELKVNSIRLEFLEMAFATLPGPLPTVNSGSQPAPPGIEGCGPQIDDHINAETRQEMLLRRFKETSRPARAMSRPNCTPAGPIDSRLHSEETPSPDA